MWDCKKGYGPALFTNYECEKCYGWALYLLLEFLPITVFYLVIVTFQVSATSGPLNVFIFSAQVNAYSLYNNTSLFIAYSSWSWFHFMLKILITFYGFWNLDFFYSVIPPFCLRENITTLHTLVLQYLPALYPLLLIVVTYTIEMLEYSCRCGGLFKDVLLLSREAYGGIQFKHTYKLWSTLHHL